MAATRRATATWEGDLMTGNGQVTAGSSGLFKEAPVTWASRTQSADGRTSPEELLAAAHAACFSMALSNELAKGGNPPKKLEVSATVTFDKVGDGFKVTKSELEVNATVPNLDDSAFQQAANGAKEGCPISGALKRNVEITLRATLAS